MPAASQYESKRLIGTMRWSAVLLLGTLSELTWAQPCDASGRLRFLGTTHEQERSLWLSATSSGSFQLQSAAGSEIVDEWNRKSRGLRLSASPFVSNGSGGTHKLLDVGGNKPCQLDTQNQKDGFTFPPLIRPPGSGPTRPGGPSARPTPPIGTLPPSGVMPGLPGGVSPPIGTLPPSGVTPTLPGGVTPPIGTLPPSGVTPTLPGGMTPPIGTLPPSGITPSLPGGVTPPIGTLPPSGITPTLPGGVTPPIGTLPPSGITPSLPGRVTPPVGTLPPSGVTPTLPGGVSPPIGTLPPSGITPTLPGGVTPPIGTLPPTGLAPGMPGGGTPPVGTLPPASTKPGLPGPATLPGEARVNVAQAGTVIDASSSPCTPVPKGDRPEDAAQPRPLDCRELATAETPAQLSSASPPLTEGREFAGDATWNLWADANYIGVSDRRHGLDLDGNTGGLTVGMDRRMSDKSVLGFTFGIENSSTHGFDNDWQLKSDGFTIGAYTSYLMSKHWVFDASFNYSRVDNRQRIVILNGDASSNIYSLSLDATGQYALSEDTLARPKLSVTYGHNSTGSYLMQGALLGRRLQVELPGVSYNFGTAEASTEFNHTFRTTGGALVMPFAEIAVRYEFERANDGVIVTGDLTPVRVSPWAGGVRLGVRALVSRATMFETRVSYLSIGQKDLNVWEARLMLSHSF